MRPLAMAGLARWPYFLVMFPEHLADADIISVDVRAHGGQGW